jgi:kinesin family member 5
VKEYQFDHVFGPDADPYGRALYADACADVVRNVLSGFNGCILAYGQTGTGKTHTMGILQRIDAGRGQHSGVIPSALQHLWEEMEVLQRTRDARWNVEISFLQIYMGTVQDLLSPDDQKLHVRENADCNGFHVDGLVPRKVTSLEEAQDTVNEGLYNRVMIPTLLNTTSSRSHTVLTIQVTRNSVSQTTGRPEEVSSKLVFVDLAGSERVKRNKSTGLQLEEAKSINTSLAALGNVAASLMDPASKHIPFRDSKLTRILQDSFGQDSNTLLVATIGPAVSNTTETTSTLTFAKRCMAIPSHARLQPVKVQHHDYEEECSRLRCRSQELERELREAKMEQEKGPLVDILLHCIDKLETLHEDSAEYADRFLRRANAPQAGHVAHAATLSRPQTFQGLKSHVDAVAEATQTALWVLRAGTDQNAMPSHNEELANWSEIFRHLVVTNAELREECDGLRGGQSLPTPPYHPPVDPAAKSKRTNEEPSWRTNEGNSSPNDPKLT